MKGNNTMLCLFDELRVGEIINVIYSNTYWKIIEDN